MWLQRMKNNIDPNCEQEELKWTCSDEYASIEIKKFGNGPDRQSDFRVILNWQDIEEIIKGMATENHKSALRSQRSLDLAAALENLLEISK